MHDLREQTDTQNLYIYLFMENIQYSLLTILNTFLIYLILYSQKNNQKKLHDDYDSEIFLKIHPYKS